MNQSKNRRPPLVADRSSGAFTLIELVVVLAILAIVLGISAVFVGAARETARQVSCKNRIRQIAIAVQTYESRAGKVPSLMSDESEASLWFTLAGDLGININPTDFRPVYAASTLPSFVPESLLCPSDFGTGANYRFNVGSTLSWQPRLGKIVPDAGNGVIVRDDAPLTTSAITDGLSHTALVCERLAGIGYSEEGRSIAVGPYLRDLSSPLNEDYVVNYLKVNFALLRKTHDGGERWTTGMWRTIGYNHILGPQSDYAGTFNRGSAWWCNYGCVPPTSLHPPGVVLATCDGAVRLVSKEVDLAVWRALGTRAARD